MGTGYIAQWHAKGIRAVPGAALEAVCDQDESRAEGFARRHGVKRWYTSLDSMLGDSQFGLDVVHVLLPPDLHASAASALVERGVHVFLEKPMATTESAAAELVQKTQAGAVSVGVNHNFLFAPVYERLRDDLKAGKLGIPDHVTITWNRELEQLQSGPFNLWMLRDPRNIVLEVGSHCLAFMLDLLGPLEVSQVQASNPMTLRKGQVFFRRWSAQAGDGAVAAMVNLSFSPGFTEQTIHVRGSLASATVDFERDTYVLRQHTPYGLDFDRFWMTTREAASLRSQAWRSIREYGLSRLKLSNKGSSYGLSIARALQSFYKGLGNTVDHRLSVDLGRQVTNLCITIGEMGAGAQVPEPAADPPDTLAALPRNGAPAEILILGATGFIGRELTRQLVGAGRAVRVLVRNPGRLPEDLQTAPGVEIVRGDLTRPEDLSRAMDGCRVVYHLARANVKTWEEFVEQDIEVTRRVAESCLSSQVERLIYTGTIDSYYAGARAGTIAESTPLDPKIAWRNLYARAKAVSEEVLLTMHRERGLPVTIFRPGIVIGRGGSPFHWGIGMWSYNAVCRVWGRGRNPLPLVLVEDVARALVLALDAPKLAGESFNLVAETEITAFDYLRALEGCAGITFQKTPTAPWKFYAADLAKWVVKQLVRHPDKRKPSYRDWETRTQKARYDCTKAEKLLNWTPVRERDELIRQGIQVPASEFLPAAIDSRRNGDGTIRDSS